MILRITLDITPARGKKVDVDIEDAGAIEAEITRQLEKEYVQVGDTVYEVTVVYV